MGVTNRVHGYTAGGWTNAAPAVCAGFAKLLQAVLRIGHLANGRTAAGVNPEGLAGAQQQNYILAFAGHQVDKSTGATSNLGTLARTHLISVNLVANRNGTTLLVVAQLV